ncbi:hypothetical protein ACFL2T_00760 [Elusimicrobiota bacterium]
MSGFGLLRGCIPTTGFLVALALALVQPASADTNFTGDAEITGQVGVSTIVPNARIGIQMQPQDAYALKVSSPNGDAMFFIDNSGKVSMGVDAPQAAVDVRGSADSGDIGLQLRVGNSSTTTDSSQIVFAYDSTSTFRHSIRTRHVASANTGNSIDFFLWNSTGDPTALGDLHVLSLLSMNATNFAAVHVMPSTGTVEDQLVVSDGSTLGNGTIHCNSVIVPSARGLKSDIKYLGRSAEEQAYQDVRNLLHANFRYKMSASEPGSETARMTGLIHEDVPASIRGSGKTIVLDARLLNLEMALKEVNGRISALQDEIAILEMRRGR